MIIGPTFNYAAMFKSMGWNITHTLRDADLLQFTGGPDISPLLYGHTRHPRTSSDALRDKVDMQFFNLAVKHHVPMAGICRGGQFLNAVNGGTMYQDVDGHEIHGTHFVRDCYFHDSYQATSTHHQVMSLGAGGILLAYAEESTRRERMSKEAGPPVVTLGKKGSMIDAEAIYYPQTNSLCFQPHPEYPGFFLLKERYFKMIDEFLLSYNWKEKTCVA
jgi:gamma-glutamyl-gamma-aminobutyrate hydrolase PuuD